MGGYPIRSLLWTNLAALGTTSELRIDAEGWPRGPGKTIFSGAIIAAQGGIGDPPAVRPWPTRLWVEMSFIAGSIRLPDVGTRANFGIYVNNNCVASAEFMAAMSDQRGIVACKFARPYSGADFNREDHFFDVRAGWHGDGVRSSFFLERGDYASTNFGVSIYELEAQTHPMS